MKFDTEELEFYINDTDDVIDAPSGTDLEQLNSRSSQPISRITVAERPAAAVYFDVGHGNDSVRGARNRANRFVLGSGNKTVHGGEHNDEIILSARPDFRQPPMLSGDLAWQTLGERLNSYEYHFDGGAGKDDSLLLNTDLRDTPYRGY
jgi:Ca2+-binding RTX toxin-like protein